MEEIRFHGRGGQGAVTAAEILAVAAGLEGKFSQAFPFFGVERRGAPVMAFARISDRPITIHQHIYRPSILVILDPTIPREIWAQGGEQALVVSNGGEGNVMVDATGIALEILGKPIVNTGMLGALLRAKPLVKPESVEKAIRERFPGELGEKNVAVFRKCYELAQSQD